MKYSTSTSTLLVTVLSLLSAATPGVDAANRHAGTRRQLDFHEASHTYAKRAPLARSPPPIQVGPKLRVVRRGPSPYDHNAGYGAVPVMDIGTLPIVGMTGKRAVTYAHNGEQGKAVDTSSTSSSSLASTGSNGSSSTNSTSTSTSSTTSSDSSAASSDDEDEEECDAEDDDDDDSTEEDLEDCDEDEEDDSSAASSSTATATDSASSASATGSTDSTDAVAISAEVNINLLKGSSSSSSSAAASSTAAASKSSSSSSSSSQSFTGTATWFTQNGNAGACGKVNPDTAHVIALYTSAYASGANCGRTVEIQNLDDGTSTTATVADMCPSCGGPEDIDLSVGTFQAIDPQYQTHGVRNIKWWFTS